MKTIYDYQKQIIKILKEKEILNFKKLEKLASINTYQERSNFLEALYNLEISEKIYNIKKGTYILFPKETYKVDYIIPTSKGLIFKKNKSVVDDNINKGKIILPEDIVVTTNDNNPKIIKVISRNTNFFKEYLLKELKEKNLTYKQIKHLAVARNKEKITELKDLLQKLEETGEIYVNNNIYQIWPENLILTKLELDKKGKPYFLFEGKRIYKEDAELKGALQEDIIAVSKRGKHIEKIIKRNIQEVVLEVVENDGIKDIEPVLIPGRGKIKTRISSIDIKKLNTGDRILASITLNKTIDGVYEANYLSTIGNINDKDIDIISIAAKYGFHINFSKEALDEATTLPKEVRKEDLTNRYDFRDRFTTFTIDCDNTKDMDDAVSITRNENGNYILAVHIADVSHYIKRGSFLDKEAYERGLSTYPANTVIPMFPSSISNGICSLNPNVSRLTKTCLMEISPTGEILNYNLVNSVIKSKIKMSYSKVNKLLNENIYDEEYKPFIDDLKLMNELSNILTNKREKEGMLTFDENEINFIEDIDGNVTDIENKTNGTAGKIIENFMILYNYCESLYLNYIIGTSINRIHQSPDKLMLNNAITKLKSLGYDLPNNQNLPISKFIQTTLDKYYNTNDYQIISEIFLKSLPKAQYSPYPTGHFGLGLNYYTHSTSPIRRYPDLKAQQIIDSYQQGKLNEIEDTNTLEIVCEHCSFKEQQADLLEREVKLIKCLKYVERHPLKCYYGTITNIDETRAYLNTITRIPGYIDYQDIPNVHYVKSKKQIKNDKNQVVLKIGDFVHVQSHNTDHKELKVNFDFLKNITLEEQNQKGATALKKNYVKKLY